MMEKKGPFSNWGNFSKRTALQFFPKNETEAIAAIQENNTLIARGNGRSYGDASLAANMLSTLRMNSILFFDRETGAIECESGMLLADLLPVIIPAGWFFHVTPGTTQITIGGAIAADVHGKNHVSAGCFSNHLISFRLVVADGRVLHCSKTENSDLFWQTCGGMGWTGLILSAKFQLMPLQSTKMIQETRHVPDLESLLAFVKNNAEYPYTAAWLSGNPIGDGIVFWGKHSTEKGGLEWLPKKPMKVSFTPPFSVINNLTTSLHNQIYKRTHPEGITDVPLEKYFYPLDSVADWNRLYGPHGFIQYQFCVGEKNALQTIKKFLTTVDSSGYKSFVTVLKRHGARPAEAVHSFPEEGFSMAMDFPNRRNIRQLINQLDEIILDAGGKIYLAKDACSRAGLSKLDPFGFGDQKFMSDQRKRLQEGWGSRPV